MKKLRIGIIGTGGIGKFHIDAYRRAAADVAEVVAVCDIDAEKAKKWLSTGAQPTDTVKALLKANGVL